MRKIITFCEIITVNVKILMVYWSGLWTLTWQAGVQFPTGDFTIFLKILQFYQTLRNYYRFQQSLAKLKPFPHKSWDSGLPLDSNKTSGTCWYVYENWSWKSHFSRSRTDKKWSWVRIPNFPMPFWALKVVFCTQKLKKVSSYALNLCLKQRNSKNRKLIVCPSGPLC